MAAFATCLSGLSTVHKVRLMLHSHGIRQREMKFNSDSWTFIKASLETSKHIFEWNEDCGFFFPWLSHTSESFHSQCDQEEKLQQWNPFFFNLLSKLHHFFGHMEAPSRKLKTICLLQPHEVIVPVSVLSCLFALWTEQHLCPSIKQNVVLNNF